ncbi:hypothetical protein AD952_14295 [Acetobacter cerevisiae]|uniref:Uncharacterized protein n=1 Tax=Acetobacter cerevisiae TaxID=178900 RepID=A0A149UNW6_9PROT|nr:hypothetical protein AD952_14295 [Acetobacter cerevisiae]
MQSGNFMKESLRTDDRIHNIRFGLLYIVTYGAAAEWKEVKEALSNWNGKTKQDWKQKIKFDELIEVLHADFSHLRQFRVIL